MPTETPHMIVIYRQAWARAKDSGNFADDVFLDALAADDAAAAFPDSEEFEVARDLYLRLWRQQVPPQRLSKHLKRALRREMFGLVKGFFSGNLPRWMVEPGDVEFIGADDWSLPMRDLDFNLTPDHTRHWQRVREHAAAHRDEDDGTMLIDCWLRVTASPDETAVLVGREPVGITSLAPDDWQALSVLAPEGLVSNGFLSIDDTQPGKERLSLSAYVPRGN